MPNRIIKESICRSDSIDSLSWFEEVLFYRLIVVCDDYGRFDGRAAVIRGACFPLKDDITKKQISEAIDKLSTAGLVRGYEVQGRPYLQLTTWNCHQQIRAKKSKYPAPDENVQNQSPGGSDTGFCAEKTSSETICNHMISDDIKCPRNRESEYENRESINGDARATGQVRRLEDFFSAYPKHSSNRHLTETAYVDLVAGGLETEERLVACAANYADACKLQETPERYIKNAENFLKDLTFEKYLPGKYRKPASAPKKPPQNGFHNFPQREYNDAQLRQMEQELLGCGRVGKDGENERAAESV